MPYYVPNGAIVRERRSASRIGEWGIEPDNYVLFLGRFSPEKNCYLLVEAFERIETNAKLVLAGGANATDPYARRLHQHASQRIAFVNYASGEAFDELLTNAMLFVLPSDIEGLSLALLEAMAAGLCVLTSDIPENRELVDGVGFTFKRGDVADLEKMLRLLMDDCAVRSAAGVQCATSHPRRLPLAGDCSTSGAGLSGDDGLEGASSEPYELPSVVPKRGSAA